MTEYEFPQGPSLPTPARPGQTVARSGRGAILGLMLIAGLTTGSLGGGVTAWTLAQSTAAAQTPPTMAAAPAVQPVANQSANTIGSLYNRVAASVVDIQTTVGGNGRFGGGGGEGSGIVVDAGHVLTNYHVVQGARTVRITLQSGTTVAATVEGTSPQDDLALLAATLPAGEVQPAKLGSSAGVQVGEEVVAIGSPFGLDHTVTAGIVSAVNRKWSSGNQPAQAMLQTDAPINPGNSGGPLFNMQGEVIGINTAIESPVQGSVGVGFAIPIDRAKSLLPQLGQQSQ